VYEPTRRRVGSVRSARFAQFSLQHRNSVPTANFCVGTMTAAADRLNPPGVVTR
jgi:hypothetical protein